MKQKAEKRNLRFVAGIFPFGIDGRGKLVAADEFLEVANDGAAGDVELPGEDGNVGAMRRWPEEFAETGLTAKSIGGAAEKFLGIDAFRAFKSLELAEGFAFAAFSKGNFDGFCEFVDVERFRKAIVRAARPLKREKTLGRFQGAGNDDDGHVRREFLEFGQEIEAKFALVENVIKNHEMRGFAG